MTKLKPKRKPLRPILDLSAPYKKRRRSFTFKGKAVNPKPKLVATFTYDRKMAMSFHDATYYQAQLHYKKRMGDIMTYKGLTYTQDKLFVTLMFEHYKQQALKGTISIFNVLININKKNKESISSGLPLPIHGDLMSIISNMHILIAAYRTVRKNKGSMTKASPIPIAEYYKLSSSQQILCDQLYEAPEGIDYNLLAKISTLVKAGTYPWGVSRLIFVPKPGQKIKKRPLTIPPFMDKVVQEAIRMVLEAIYEPTFQDMNCSFGFRASNGVHHAITMLSEPRISNGMHMALEGDIESAYPNLDRDILLNVLSERISDNKFLSFMKKRLKLQIFDVDKQKYESTFLGIPQGGIDSPYLWNIYLLGLDVFVKKTIQEKLDKLNDIRLTSKARGAKGKEKKIKNPPVSKTYNALSRRLVKLRNQYKVETNWFKTCDKDVSFISVQAPNGSYHIRSRRKTHDFIFKKVEKIRLTSSKLRKVRSTDPNRVALKLVYSRYADDWIIFTNAPEPVLKEIRKEIADWLLLHRKATLSFEKTLITDMRKTEAHFLGFQFVNHKSQSRLKKFTQKNNKGQERTVLKRTAGWSVRCSPDKQRLINRMFMKSYCDKTGFPKEIPFLSTLETEVIIERFNDVLRGMANFYTEFCTYKSSLTRWLYIVRWSCIKTLAQKYKTTCSGIIKRFANNPDKRISYRTNINFFSRETKSNVVYYKDSFLFTEKEVMDLALEINRKPKIQRQLLDSEKHKFFLYDANLKLNIDGELNYTRQRTPRIHDSDFLKRISFINWRTICNLDLPCTLCGADKTEMHHFKHVRKTKFMEIGEEDWGINKIMSLRNRRQIPLCKNCHMNKVHAGTYKGPSLGKLINFDNRIVNSEGNITMRLAPYRGKPFEQRLILKDWVKK